MSGIPIPISAPAEDRMTHRARAYLGIAAARHVLLGLLCILDPATFTSPSYEGILSALPIFHVITAIEVWGVVFIVTGSVCAAAAGTARAGVARLGLTMSAVVSAMWVGGFLASALSGALAGWSGPVVWAALVAKDLTMLRDPLRNPFEDLVPRTIGYARR